MTNKDKVLRVLYAHSDRERLINFKLFPGSDRNTTSSEVYEALADSITKERMGRLKEIKLEMLLTTVALSFPCIQKGKPGY